MVKTTFCSCGDTQVEPKRFGKSYIAECSTCGEPKPVVHDEFTTDFLCFVSESTKTEIMKKFKDYPAYLTEALRLKNIQEEEDYKRKLSNETMRIKD